MVRLPPVSLQQHTGKSRAVYLSAGEGFPLDSAAVRLHAIRSRAGELYAAVQALTDHELDQLHVLLAALAFG